jgi:hypothetical protein
MSDKSIIHDIQLMARVYHNEVIKHHPARVLVATTNKRRHVLTTRRDGHIQFEVDENSRFTITTEVLDESAVAVRVAVASDKSFAGLLEAYERAAGARSIHEAWSP